jgi:hypothetical membrane protein
MTTTSTLVAAATPARPPHRPNRLLRAGLVAGPLFVAFFLVQPLFRDHYHPMRDPVSELSLGPAGWVQVVSFLIAGTLCLLFALGLRRALRPGPGSRAAPLLLAIWGVGLLGAGTFRTDRLGATPTWPGQMHDLAFSLPGFIAFAAAMFVLAYAYARRRRPVRAVYSALSGIAFTVLFVLTTTGFAQDPGTHLAAHAGLLQRLTVGVGWLWLTVVAARELRADRTATGARPRR